MTGNFDCRKCRMPHASATGQLCDLCEQGRIAEAHARNIKSERKAKHKHRQEFASMFGGNRHTRRRDLSMNKGR